MSIKKVLVMGLTWSEASLAASYLREQMAKAITYSPAKCDYVNCRLGKHETCQTFSPSKKGKCK